MAWIECLVALGDIDGARPIVDELRRIAPGFLASRLAGRTTILDPAPHRRAWTSLRIAAGLEPPEAADALRGAG